MKTLATYIVIIASLFLSPNLLYAQSPGSGTWEGNFMNDFKTIIEFADEEDKYSGTIKMYNGDQLIQDDPLSEIKVVENTLTFHIAAKETDFKGEIKKGNTEISGVFIFPDKSEHPITVFKKDKNTSLNTEKETKDLRKEQKYASDELHADLNYWIENLEKHHPALFNHVSENEFKRLAEVTRNRIQAKMSVAEFYATLAPLVEAIKCSHTGIRLPKVVQEEINSNPNFLPLKLVFQKNRVYCIHNYDANHSEIKEGDQILSVNDYPIEQIVKQLSSFISSEGNNKSTKEYQLNKNFNQYLNLMDNSREFKVEFLSSGDKKTAILEACEYVILDNKSAIQSPFSFNMEKEYSTGFLRVKLFAADDINRFIQKMDSMFLVLKKQEIQNLIIDLRGNSGGHPIFAAQLLSYLSGGEFTYFKRNNEIPDFEPLYNPMQANPIQFAGEIFVLVDGGCLSTTGHFIALLKHYSNAKFIGVEPGSTVRCNDFSFNTRLPKTGIEVNIPRTTFEVSVSEYLELPFIVDFEVENSVEDYIQGIDRPLLFVKEFISKQSANSSF